MALRKFPDMSHNETELLTRPSEKLLTEINQTWEQRLEKTQQIHKEREQALEELGISIEKGSVGISTPKKIPHLVNLRFASLNLRRYFLEVPNFKQ